MKKKFMFTGMLAMLLAWGIAFAACSNDAQDVAFVNASKVGTVTVEKASDTSYTYTRVYAIVAWDAVDNAIGYEVYVQQEGKKTIEEVGYGQNSYIYSSVTGAYADNADVDKWSSRITIDDDLAGKNVRFGVVAYSWDGNKSNSDMSWSPYVHF